MNEKAAEAFDRDMTEVLASTKPADPKFPSITSPTSGDLHVVKHVSKGEVPLSGVRISQPDYMGENVACYFYANGRMYGVETEAHAQLRRVITRIVSDKTYADSLSVEYTYARAVDWLQERVAAPEATSPKFTQYLAPLATAAIREHELWFPIPVLRVDCEFGIGPVTFRRITKSMMDALAESTHADRAPQQLFAFNATRSRFQGAAAACVVGRARWRLWPSNQLWRYCG